MMESKDDENIERFLERDIITPDFILGDTSEEDLRSERFKIIREIGRGGVCNVYLAHDRTLNRNIALKVLSRATPQDIDRFQREARLAAKLTHANIVQIYETGMINNKHYISMQYIDGNDLRGRKLSLQDSLEVIHQIAKALQYAHDEGVIHRDIKPSNIMMDKMGRVYLTDLGLAKQLDPNLTKQISITGMIMGTPNFMSPEQARGDVHKVDTLSDIYSLGATLYYMITGKEPYQGISVMEIINKVIHEDVLEPRTIRKEIPIEVEAIIMKAMAKDRAQRYQTAIEFAEDIRRYMDGEPITARKISIATRMFKKAKRHKVKLALFILFILLGLIAAYSFIQRIRSEEILKKATESISKAEGYINEFDDQLFLPVSDLTKKFYLLDNAIKEAENVIKITHNQLADPFYIIARSLFKKGDYDDALKYINKAISKSRQPRFIFERAKIYAAISDELILLLKEYDQESFKEKKDELKDKRINDFKEVIKLDTDKLRILEAESSIAIFEREKRQDVLFKIETELNLTEDDKIRLLLYRMKSGILVGLGQLDKAIECLDKAIIIARSNHQIYSSRAFVYFLKGMSLARSGQGPISDFDKAIADYLTVLSIVPVKYLYYIQIAHIYMFKAQYLASRGIDPWETISQAENYCEKAIEKDPGFAQAQLVKATILHQKSFLVPEPLEPIKDAIKICEKIIQQGSSDHRFYLLLGDLYSSKYTYSRQDDDFTSSLKYYQKALQIEPEISQRCYKAIASSYIKKAEAMITNEPMEEIKNIILYTEKLDPQSRDYNYYYSMVHSLMAQILFNKNDKTYVNELKKSLEYLDKIVELGKAGPEILISRAKTLKLLGRNKEAISDLRQAMKMEYDVRKKRVIEALIEKYSQEEKIR